MPARTSERGTGGRSRASGPVILQTKLARPPLRAAHVARRELLELLRDGATRKLTLLTAPPGFGKTTLLAEFAAAEQDRSVAWLSLDDDDNDPARFFAYVVETLRAAAPDIGTRAVSALSTPDAGLVDTVLPLFLNDLTAQEAAVVLVLDDYHLITNADIHEAVAYLIERMPESIRLVIATREDPPLPLARLRARGELLELRAGELRFNGEEARAFLDAVLDLDLSAQDVERLQARTEGWPAALYLAALSLRGRNDASTWIGSFAGDDRHLVDYLTVEVLARQPAELCSFLLRTSILKRLSGPLCDAVAGREGSARILEELERSNLLLIPLDTKREWYRYHQLFAELLQHELARTDADVLPILHRRASAWYGEAGLIVEAANHATAAGDVDAAVELVGRHYPLFLDQGQLATVDRWLEALPSSVIADNWLLCIAAATVTSHTNRVDEAERWLGAAERAEPLARNGQRPDGPVATARAWLRLLRGDVDRAIEDARRGLTDPGPDPTSTLNLQLILGSTLWWSGKPIEAQEVLEQAEQTARAAPLSAATIFTLGFRAVIALDAGDTAQSEALAREAIELTRRADLEEHPFTAMAHIASGKAHARRSELKEATDEIERGTQLAERAGSWVVTVYGLLALAEVRHHEHEPAAARRLLGRARSMLEALPDPAAGLARVEQTEQTLRLRPAGDGDSSSAPFWELSDRELSVLRLLAGRLSQREIAAELYVSFNTVKSHTRSIFRKLGVASRAEAVARARELGLL